MALPGACYRHRCPYDLRLPGVGLFIWARVMRPELTGASLWGRVRGG